MKKKNTVLQFSGLFLLAIIFFIQTGCKKEENNDESGTAEFNVSLKSSTSSRSDYEAVNIDIQKVTA